MVSSSRKKMLITGAFGGMGAVCSRLAAEEGYDLILVDLSVAGLDALQPTLPAGTAVSAHALDVTDAQGVAALARDIGANGGVDAVIHTVGVTPNMTTWQRIVDIDLVSSIRFLEAVREVMNEGGAAVCISSSSGYLAPYNAGIDDLLADPLQDNLMEKLDSLPNKPLENTGLAYSYAKKALRFYVSDYAMRWGREGKRLTSISPGLIATDAGTKEVQASKTMVEMVNNLPLSRMGRPDEIATVALFLVSDKASYISGCDILVDGGMLGSMGKMRPQ